jgi:hypothetical protein
VGVRAATRINAEVLPVQEAQFFSRICVPIGYKLKSMTTSARSDGASTMTLVTTANTLTGTGNLNVNATTAGALVLSIASKLFKW